VNKKHLHRVGRDRAPEAVRPRSICIALKLSEAARSNHGNDEVPAQVGQTRGAS